jgi:hypothetical protein
MKEKLWGGVAANILNKEYRTNGKERLSILAAGWGLTAPRRMKAACCGISRRTSVRVLGNRVMNLPVP